MRRRWSPCTEVVVPPPTPSVAGPVSPLRLPSTSTSCCPTIAATAAPATRRIDDVRATRRRPQRIDRAAPARPGPSRRDQRRRGDGARPGTPTTRHGPRSIVLSAPTIALTTRPSAPSKGLISTPSNAITRPSPSSSLNATTMARSLDSGRNLIAPDHRQQPGQSAWTVDDLRRVQCPTLLIAGEDDPFANTEQMITMKREIPGAEWLIVNHAGHAVHAEHPEVVGPRIVDFLLRHS